MKYLLNTELSICHQQSPILLVSLAHLAAQPIFQRLQNLESRNFIWRRPRFPHLAWMAIIMEGDCWSCCEVFRPSLNSVSPTLVVILRL